MNWLREHRTKVYLFVVLLACYGYFFPRWASWSQNSRLDLVLAIVDEGTLNIDNYYENTGDYAYYDGHYYSDKAPGLSFLGVPFYALHKGITAIPPVYQLIERVAHTDAFQATLRENGAGLQTQRVYFALALYFVTFFTVSVPAALLGVLLFKMLVSIGSSKSSAFWVTLVYGLATPAFAYGGMLFSHQLVAFSLFAAFSLVFSQREKPTSGRHMFLVGLLLGWAIITEYPAVLVALGVGLYALWSQRSVKTVIWGALGGLVPGCLLMAYDWTIFGTVMPVGYLYSVNYHHLHDIGLVSVTYPQIEAMWGITFGSFRGLFFLAPIMLLSVPGMVVWWRRRVHSPEWAVCVWAALSLFLFTGSSIMWEGGFAVGPRYLLPMLPFMTMGLGFVWEEITAHRAGSLAVGALVLWSVVAVWLETISGQSFPDWTPNPLFDYSLPRFISGDIARNLGMAVGLRGQLSLLPLLGGLAGLALLYCRGPLVRREMAK